jgi:hypothetical protein
MHDLYTSLVAFVNHFDKIDVVRSDRFWRRHGKAPEDYWTVGGSQDTLCVQVP